MNPVVAAMNIIQTIVDVQLVHLSVHSLGHFQINAFRLEVMGIVRKCVNLPQYSTLNLGNAYLAILPVSHVLNPLTQTHVRAVNHLILCCRTFAPTVPRTVFNAVAQSTLAQLV